MSVSHEATAAFIRGFFVSLEQHGRRSAVLHGGENGFEHEISDVDFAVDAETFTELHHLIRDHCAASGWLLCQILRHETTAAYFVCSDKEDPARSVALDACSDYQRNGTLFLTAHELLENRRPLPWGGHGLSPHMELRYRFTKAAAKKKDSGSAAVEFAIYPDESRQQCEAWLTKRWCISLESWESSDLAKAFALIRDKSNSRPSMLQPGAASRILSRIIHPTGLIVVTGDEDFDTKADLLKSGFGKLHFRHFRKEKKWQIAFLKELITSTLIILPQLSSFWRKILPAVCVHTLDPASPANDLAEWLHHRCVQREST
ncbi:MAG: hypothetical protein ACSHX9_05170 [Luteolibacter sp.]